MATVVEAGEILTSPLGSLVYHLLLFLAVEAMLGIAWEESRRSGRGQAGRLMIAAGGLTVVRLVYVAGALVAFATWIQPDVLLPPLERFMDTASLALFAWLVLPRPGDGRHVRSLALLLIANLAVALIAAVVLTVLWNGTLAARPGGDYNATWQAILWGGWQIGLAAVVGLAALRKREEGWALFLLAMVPVIAGAVVQIVNPYRVPHLPVWVRVGNLIAYPLLALAVYRSVVSRLRLQSRELQEISQASMDQIRSLLLQFEASREMSSLTDLPAVLDSAAEGIARALGADECAIALPEENDAGQMRLAALYNPARPGRGEDLSFPLDYQLAVRQVMRRKRYDSIDEPGPDNLQLKVLFGLLGSPEVGPLLIYPLLTEDDEAIGAIIAGNSRSRRAFGLSEIKLCQSMAEQLAVAIQNSRRFQELQTRVDELTSGREEEGREPLPAGAAAETKDEQRRLQQVAAQAEELRGAIGAISNYTHLMRSDLGRIPGAQSKILLRLQGAVDGAAQGVDNLTRLAGGMTLPTNLQTVDIREVTATAVAEFQPCLDDKKMGVDLRLPAALPPVAADLDRLRQVLSHLLLNAFLASPPGSRIEVGARHMDGTASAADLPDTLGDRFVVVAVRDCGGGLAHNALDSVFDRSRPIRCPEGLGASGADLAMVRSLVEAQHGHVWVETEKGAGTTISFALPVGLAPGGQAQQHRSP